MLITQTNINELAWDKADNGLLPLIVQHEFSGKVLMQGYADIAALEKTFATGHVTFYSRSKNRLWTKGEESGNTLTLVELSTDCDKDSLIALAKPAGPTCHLGTETCWDQQAQPNLSFLSDLQDVIASRKGADANSSYTASLYAKGVKRISQKVGEEGVEVALAATSGDKAELICESADLLYHLTVLLQSMDLELNDVIEKLKERHAK
ncbi:bifunctional phosphoribosyl-AMP cyclohydrolase/phosphoribosyl-ATP diphosphatase HisIE [Catenovulum sp. 2E275]|uniref:bifunctional phosphoribosyl-AMP cyclohydrolase/phosphoribosyl-ATP diphosphatase HisIE n=1 Tax=Catenovulum sp. 2E275 TaxID=2980497 RepID=UPI0021D39BF1|nr:bifunctional phosphoribosyl-AMP cyclohydrolase/phosphoribosyl-ATP diphosphatase HisIE [Catenovulum sp. 2E275]MCU4677148.1 bifunctional phosphoribosyl-AMP cyclohydrolase/phosphoribosyl-ATP diphosphatase HisIE [Catenovulum sp. 2E275]